MVKQKPKGNLMTALYERLSKDDDLQGESNSILNQKRYLEDYAKQSGFSNLRHFTDDGYTGTNFNRPGFKAMMAEVDAGHVGTIIVKDMSRFGRNYLQVGQYTEIYFPDKGVRFIAVNNNVDSASPTENDFTPFLNIMNDWYAKDTSRKVKSVFRSMMVKGQRCTGSVPYGYIMLKDGDKKQMYIDEEAASVVRRIFEMTAAGISATEIAETLQEAKVLCPRAYDKQTEGRQNYKMTISNPYRWTRSTVAVILNRQDYVGTLVLGKSVRVSFHSKKRVAVDPNEWLVFPNAHEPIVNQELWDAAQKQRKRCLHRMPYGTHTHRLKGLVWCADCGSKMYYKEVARENGKPKSNWQCGRYAQDRKACCSHELMTKPLEEAIKASIKLVTEKVLEDPKAFADELQQQYEEQAAAETSADLEELKKINDRIDELDRLIQNLYQKNVDGSVPDRQFERMINQFNDEQVVCESRKQELEKNTVSLQEHKSDAKRFMALIRKYKNCDEVTDTMLYELVDRIEVHKPLASGTKYKYQQIDIYFSFVGNIAEAIQPTKPIDEEAYLAEVHRKQEEDARIRTERKNRKRRKTEKEIREAARAGDPEAQIEYEKILAKDREYYEKRKERKKALRESSPDYIADPVEREKAIHQKAWETRRKNHPELAVCKAEIRRRAEAGDPEAIEQAKKIQEEENAAKRKSDRKRMAEDPEYAARRKEQQKEFNRKYYQKAKADYAELKAKAETGDEEAIAKVAEIRKANARRQKKWSDDLKERAQSDPEAAAQFAEWRERHNAQTMNHYYALKEAAKTDPAAAEKWKKWLEDSEERNREHRKKKKQKQEGVYENDQEYEQQYEQQDYCPV